MPIVSDAVDILEGNYLHHLLTNVLYTSWLRIWDHL